MSEIRDSESRNAPTRTVPPLIQDGISTDGQISGSARKPRVLHVVDSLEIGGTERLVHDLVIARGGETTSVACLESIGAFGVRLQETEISVELIGNRGGFSATSLRLWRYVRRVRPDVIHCHNVTAALFGGLAARLAGDIPVVMTKHGAGIPGRGLAPRLCRFLIRRAEVVGVSRQAMEIMGAWIGERHPPRLSFIPNGISLADYRNLTSRSDARKQLGLPANAFIIGIVARVTPIKGHLLLIDAFAKILTQLPEALLIVVGDGPGFPDMKARITALEIEKSVLAMGERHDVPAILAALDVFCLPSRMEGMPMTVLEAMAAELPVVATNVGGIPQVIDQGLTGLMVPSEAAQEVEAALLKLARDPELAREMGRRGRQKVVREFSLERTAAAYEELYRMCVARRPGTRQVGSPSCAGT